MLTLNEAVALTHGTTLYSMHISDARGYPAQCRVTGKVQRWKRDPERFSVPVKYGLYDSFRIEPDNMRDWTLDEYASEIDPLRIMNQKVSLDVQAVAGYFVITTDDHKAKDAARFKRHDGSYMPVFLLDNAGLILLAQQSSDKRAFVDPERWVESVEQNAPTTFTLKIPSAYFLEELVAGREVDGLTILEEEGT